MSVIYCEKCWNAARPRDHFCRKCGASLASLQVSKPSVPVCSACGAVRNPTDKFCVKCGVSLDSLSGLKQSVPDLNHSTPEKNHTMTKVAQPVPEKIRMGTKIVCPECGKDDMIQKVSALYSGGVSTTNYQQPVAVQTDNGMIYGNVDKTAVSHTNLAKRLSPPTRPEDSSFGCVSLVLSFIVPLSLFFPIASGVRTNTGVIITIIIVGGACVGWFYFIKGRQEAHKKVFKDGTISYESRKRKWDELYYCSRNDCVFNPATGKSASPERKFELLS